jgi:Family of unknown function (DUF6941)
MASLEYFLVAESVSIDAHSNRVSLFQVLEEVHGPRPDGPAGLPALAIVSAWNIEAEEFEQDFQVQVSMLKPTGAQVGHHAANFTPKQRRHRIISRILGVVFDEAGEWKINVDLNGVHAASHTITVAFDADAVV